MKSETISSSGVLPLFAKQFIANDAQIQKRVKELSLKIEHDYRGRVTPENPLVLICILKGSYIFTADLARSLRDVQVPNIVDFICVSSYGANARSSGEVRMLLDLRTNVSGLHCLIVEDIIDSALTLDFLHKMFSTRAPLSLKTICLLDKPAGRKIKFVVDYVGFEIPNEFVVGYGLDYNEQYRDLRDIVVLKPEVYESNVALKPDTIPSKI